MHFNESDDPLNQIFLDPTNKSIPFAKKLLVINPKAFAEIILKLEQKSSEKKVLMFFYRHKNHDFNLDLLISRELEDSCRKNTSQCSCSFQRFI